ncbi:MAG TPA: hypothetical protein DDZ68_06180, partial [Parvularcula sp.]|nr:hypothetical protein [Parvularcula sp.]HBS31892.1 hypothetical protein [Parvularcula sp.]
MTDAAIRSVDIRLSAAALGAVALQTALVLLWSGAAAERLSAVEAKTAASAELSVRIARLEEQVIAMRAQLVRIETKLEEGR